MGDHTNLRKTCTRENFDELCLRQSTGNSTGPQVDVVPGVLRELVGDEDVAEL